MKNSIDTEKNENQNTQQAETVEKKNSFSWVETLKYTCFALSAGLVQIGSFALLNDVLLVNLAADFRYWIAYLPSLILSILWNFTLNRKFTFKSASNIPIAMLKVAAYYVVFTPLSTWWGDALDRASVDEYIILIGTMLINFVTEFLFCKFFVFAPKYNVSVDKKQ